jgi:hypothetical protein
MKVIDVTAPFSIEDLKLYFEDDQTFYMVDYENSQLQGTKLLTYLSNLELPCNIGFTDQKDFDDLTREYLLANFIISIPILEERVISLLLQMKGISELIEKDFIDDNVEILTTWAKKLDSLSLYNFKSFPEDDTKDLTGINFVNLLKYESFYLFYANVIEHHKTYYKSYFNEYMFKGNNLFSYWANVNNPMFLITSAIATGEQL